MSEYIVHTALMQDCFNILLASGKFSEEFKHVARTEREFGEAASTTKSGDVFTWRILDDLKGKWQDRKPEDRLEAKLAFVLGWVSHRAADREMKPVFRAAISDLEKAKNGNLCSLYQEAEIYKAYYLNTENDPFKDTYDLLLNEEKFPQFDLAQTKTLFNGMLRMAFMRMHTTMPDTSTDVEGIEKWIDHIYNFMQIFKINMECEADIIANPNPEYYKRFVVDTNFFDKSDSLIVLAKKLRAGEQVSAEEVDSAMDAPCSSHYAIALACALKYVKACNDFFIGKISLDELRGILDIGKLGRDGRSV